MADTVDGRLADAIMQLMEVRYEGVVESERFWRNFAALCTYARSDLAPPLNEALRLELEPLMKRNWVDFTLERLPWQQRALHGIELAEWMKGKRTRKNNALVIPAQRNSSPIRGGRA